MPALATPSMIILGSFSPSALGSSDSRVAFHRSTKLWASKAGTGALVTVQTWRVEPRKLPKGGPFCGYVRTCSMDTSLDLTAAPREVLLAIIAQQQAAILELQLRHKRSSSSCSGTLEGKAKPGGPLPGLKPKADQKPGQTEQPRRKPRQPRRHGFARTRMTPTRRVEHVLEECPGCGTGLSGGWTQRPGRSSTCWFRPSH